MTRPRPTPKALLALAGLFAALSACDSAAEDHWASTCGFTSYAQPVVELPNSHQAVPVDVTSVRGGIRFDVHAKTATADIEMRFQVGDDGGWPVFDLRQSVDHLELDGVAVDASKVLRRVDFAEAQDTGGVLVLTTTLKPCSIHTLRFRYTLTTPSSIDGTAEHIASLHAPLSFRKGEVRWFFPTSDLSPGRYAEMWLPTVPWSDGYDVALDLLITNSDAAHRLVSNGDVTTLANNHWLLRLDSTHMPTAPMIEIIGESRYYTHIDDSASPTIEVVSDYITNLDRLEDFAADVRASINKTIDRFGPYPQGDRFTAVLTNTRRGAMEYAGGATFDSPDADTAEHEVMHSWFGRGVTPAQPRDAWWDEAWVAYSDAFDRKDFGDDRPLFDRDPWIRQTWPEAYSYGATFFTKLAGQLGEAKLNTLMSSFAQSYMHRPASTADLERHLYCETGAPVVLSLFNEAVWGLGAERTVPACDARPSISTTSPTVVASQAQ